MKISQMPRFPQRALLVGFLAFLSACASRGDVEGVSPETRFGSGWLVRPAAAEVAQLRQESERFSESPACLGSLLAEAHDLSHALWLETEGPERARLSEAFATQGIVTYSACDSARAKAPEEFRRGDEALRAALEVFAREPSSARQHAEEAARIYASAGGGVMSDEAWLVVAGAALAAEDQLPELSSMKTPAQRVQAGLLRLGAAAGRPDCTPLVEAAIAAGHGSALERIVASLDRRELTLTRSALEVQLERSGLAARRGAGALALLSATKALNLVGSAPSKAHRHRARLAMAQARLTLGQPAEAAEEALSISDDGPSAESLARAESLAGQALWARQQPRAAAEAYQRSAVAAKRFGSSEVLARARLNRAAALLSAGEDLGEVRRSLAPVRGASAEAESRRTILLNLLNLLEGHATGPEAARQIEACVQVFDRIGAHEAYARYCELPKRLRERARAVAHR